MPTRIATETTSSMRLRVIADYPIAVLKAAKSQTGATQFVDFVLSPDGQALLKAAGFQGA
ncbi:MAG: extracellular solute-binding protein [Chloroflexi bacterium]|nr:MAG: extracellular solute-binding protein [Chloroflexota bacterium]